MLQHQSGRLLVGHQQQQALWYLWQWTEVVRANSLWLGADIHNQQSHSNKFPITFNQGNKAVFITPQCLSCILDRPGCCWWLICLFLPATNCCYWLWRLISSSTTSASILPSVLLPYLGMTSLSLCIMYTPYLTDMGLLGFVLCSPSGFYCTPHCIFCCWLYHWGAPSSAECILPNKSV